MPSGLEFECMTDAFELYCLPASLFVQNVQLQSGSSVKAFQARM